MWSLRWGLGDTEGIQNFSRPAGDVVAPEPRSADQRLSGFLILASCFLILAFRFGHDSAARHHLLPSLCVFPLPLPRRSPTLFSLTASVTQSSSSGVSGSF